MKNRPKIVTNTKNYFWFMCCIISVIYALLILSIPIIYIINAGDIEASRQFGIFVREYGDNFFVRLIGFVGFIFWIYNIVDWYQRRGSVKNLLLLIFFNVIYSPIYYIRIVMKQTLRN